MYNTFLKSIMYLLHNGRFELKNGIENESLRQGGGRKPSSRDVLARK